MAERWRVVVADDEPLARERLRALLERRAAYDVVAECETGNEAVEAILAHRPDVVFLDIRMPGLDGLQVAEALESGDAAPPVVVFVTAHDEFALRAFDLSAADYVLKPVDRDRFDRALDRVEARLRAGAAAELPPNVREFLEQLRRERAYAKRFLVHAPKGYYFVNADDIDWVDAQGNYARLHAGGRAHMLRATMKGLEAQLDPERFVRVHRSAIVNIDHVARFEPYTHGEYVLHLRDGVRLTSSHAHSTRLRELLRDR